MDGGARGGFGVPCRRMMRGCTSGWVTATAIDKIVVKWPSGREQTLEKQGVDRVLTIEEPK